MMNEKTTDPHLMKMARDKVSGLNHLWDGPFDTTGYPKGQGSSSGKNGMKLKTDCGCGHFIPEPITQRAKNR